MGSPVNYADPSGYTALTGYTKAISWSISKDDIIKLAISTATACVVSIAVSSILLYILPDITGIILSVVPIPDGCKSNAMVVQIQALSSHNYSKAIHATPTIGVTASQVRNTMSYLFSTIQSANWFPTAQMGNLRSAIIRMSQRLTGFVLGGGTTQGGNIAREYIDQQKIYRLDLENKSGHNLRF
jgi:hypothetical protein